MTEEINWLTVGKLVAPHGLRGEVRVNPSSDFPDRFIKPGNRWLQKNNDNPKKVKLLQGRRMPGKTTFIVAFAEISNRRQAELIVGEKLLVPSSERPLLGKNEFHLLDLLGLKVKVQKNLNVIGRITNLTSAGNDLLEIELIEGKKVLVPFVHEIVPEVNLEKGFVVISPPKGLLDL